MTSGDSSSSSVEEQFDEVFQFLNHERSDVRKMSLRGIAQHSKDNGALRQYLGSGKNRASAIETLMNMLQPRQLNMLGDVLTILINCVDESSGIIDQLVSQNAMRKGMRLLDGLDRCDAEREGCSEETVAALKEMTLMFINNVTACSVEAVLQMLQVEDEDLRGYYVSKLYTHYLRAAPPGVDGDAAGSEGMSRNLHRWILGIILNLTRTKEGQTMVLVVDDDWRTALMEALQSASDAHRYYAASILRSGSVLRDTHKAIAESRAISVVCDRFYKRRERVSEVQVVMVEFLANMLVSEEGMQAMEEINAKKYLLHALAAETLGAGDAVLSAEAVEILEKNIIPFLDDIQDAIVMEK